MENRIKGLLVSLLIFCAGGSLFAAESLLYDLSGVSPVWDISGVYDVSGGSLIFVQDNSGRVIGGGSINFSEEGLDYSSAVTVKGSLKQSKGICSVSLTILYKGMVTDGVNSEKFTLTQKLVAEIDTELLEIIGVCQGSWSCAGTKESWAEQWITSLPYGMDGTCVLVLNTAETAKGILGSAALNLSNSEVINFDIKGSNKKGVVKLALKGSKATGDSGASLSLEIDALSGVIKTLKGKVLGQTLSGAGVSGSSSGSGGGGSSGSVSVIGGGYSAGGGVLTLNGSQNYYDGGTMNNYGTLIWDNASLLTLDSSLLGGSIVFTNLSPIDMGSLILVTNSPSM
jgi:hypothetical protein